MNRKVLITGASRGIGRAIAQQFASQGDELFLICRKETDKLNELKKELEESCLTQVHTFRADVGKFEEVEAALSGIPDLDIVVNNAGISYIGLLTDMTVEDWDNIVSVNLSSLFYISRMVIPGMVRNKKGKIINISSVWGNVGASMEVAYSATKGGVNSFTRALAKELAPSNISVNAIACGVIDTDMNSCFSKEEMQELVNEIPADRIGKAEEVAQLVSQLSDSSSYLTGQVITMDGGWI